MLHLHTIDFDRDPFRPRSSYISRACFRLASIASWHVLERLTLIMHSFSSLLVAIHSPRRLSYITSLSTAPVSYGVHPILIATSNNVRPHPPFVLARSSFVTPSFSISCRSRTQPTPQLNPAFKQIRCGIAEISISETLANETHPKWKTLLSSGSVVEAWCDGKIRFAHVSSLYEKGIVAILVVVSPDRKSLAAEKKISFGEILAVWPQSITPSSAQALLSIVNMGLTFLKNCMPRSLDLSDIYARMRKFPKTDTRASRCASDMALPFFGIPSSATLEHRAAATVAAAMLFASDSTHFKRGEAGYGWRALPPSVTIARGRCSFVDTCKSIFEKRAAGTSLRTSSWAREHLEILRDIEIIAASGSNAGGTAATSLKALGYKPTDVGAAHLLVDIEYWSTGSVEMHGGGTTQRKDQERPKSIELVSNPSEKDSKASKVPSSPNANTIRDWTFPAAILDEARELRTIARRKRLALIDAHQSSYFGRRTVIQSTLQKPVRIYCVDDKHSRFLDDALSVRWLVVGRVVRLFLHVTDVDEVVKSGSAIDSLAKERGQSLYLPLKPLHMLPAAAMDAASFSSTFPTHAITVMIDFDFVKDTVSNWEVFASMVPPVKRLNYTQLDYAIENNAQAADISEEECEDLRLMAKVAPLLATKLDHRRSRRKGKVGVSRLEGFSDESTENMDSKAVAGVRLVNRTDRSTSKSIRIAKVVEFQTTGAHSVVDDILTSGGSLMRQFAKENRAFLPEDRDAASYAARCGTAPLRRYADLATQRQIKCVLFGKPPAGRRRMDELRIWLAKRHSAGERTVAERRRSALFESLSAHCAQHCAAMGTTNAIIRGQVRSISITRKSELRIDITLDGTGLSTIATVSDGLLATIFAKSQSSVSSTKEVEEKGIQESKEKRNQKILHAAMSILPSRCKVRVQIWNIDTSAQDIQATISRVMG